MSLRTSDFDFELPHELIAQRPPAERGQSRLLVLSHGRIALECATATADVQCIGKAMAGEHHDTQPALREAA